MAELANGVPQEGEEVSDAQAEEGGEEEQEATLIKKSMKLESQLDEDAANKENVDDKTEDQVPDITNNEDPMTTSMDGIEEISANEDAVKEVPVEIMNGGDAVENGVEKAGDEEEAAAGGGGAEDENTEKDVAEIPVNVYEEEAEKPAEEAEPQPEADAEAEAPAEPEAEQPPAEAEEPAAETAAEEPAAEEAKPEEEAEPNEVEEEPFELQAPPVPKRPRTPNEMDEPQADEEQEEAPLAESEQPATEEQPAMADVPIEVEGLPSTPKSVGSIPIEVEGLPSSPKSGSRRGSGGSALSAGGKGGPGTPKEPSIASPVPATPKSGGTTTPKSTRSGKGAFDFGIEPAGKRSGSKKTTFEDEVLSVKSSKSRSPRSPRSPRARKSAPEPEPPAEEAPNAEEPAADAQEPAEADAASEDEKIRQASLDRLKEREEEEQRWKRMTSWDKSEDGDNKPPPTAPEPAIEEEKSEAGAGEEEAPAEAEADQQPPAESEDQQEAPAGDEAAEESAQADEAAAEDQEAAAEAVAAEGEEVSEAQEKAPSAAEGGEVEGSPPPPPPRPERSPSPVSYRREPTARSGSDYRAYDQDLKTEQVPAQMTANESFSSWAPVERESYKPISPWVDRTSKYRNEYTVGEPPVAPSAYTAFFDDMVSSGPFASSLYSTSRLLERSRSRTRERRQAMRSQSQARNYFRYASQNPAPLRSRDYSTPPSSMVSRAPTSPGSFVSFMDYAGQKQYEMARSQSLRRTPLYQSNLALSRSISRGGVDYYLGSGRSSRVDSYVDSMHRPYEYNVPSNYEMYRASSRGQVGYAPLNHYQSYVDTLQRSLSRERYERDRLRNKYTTVSYQLEQACKQMDLLRSSNYSALRSGSAPRTSVYANFYPYF